MWRTFYHTERRTIIYADVVDLGRLPAPPAATGDELLEPEPWQDRRKPPNRKPGWGQKLLIDEANRQSGTATELARRAGVPPYLARYVVKRPPFAPVGSKKVAGIKRIVYGIK